MLSCPSPTNTTLPSELFKRQHRVAPFYLISHTSASAGTKLPRAEIAFFSTRTKTLLLKSFIAVIAIKTEVLYKEAFHLPTSFIWKAEVKKKNPSPKLSCCIIHKSDIFEFKSQPQVPSSLKPRQMRQRATWDTKRFLLVPISWELPHMKGRNWKSSKPHTPWLPAGSILYVFCSFRITSRYLRPKRRRRVKARPSPVLDLCEDKNNQSGKGHNFITCKQDPHMQHSSQNIYSAPLP